MTYKLLFNYDRIYWGIHDSMLRKNSVVFVCLEFPYKFHFSACAVIFPDGLRIHEEKIRGRA